MTVIFENRRQALKARLLTLLLILPFSAGMMWWGWDLFQTFGLSPGDGGVLRPLVERIAVGGFVGGLGLITGVAMMIYAMHYAVRVLRDGDRLHIETLTPWALGHWHYEFPVTQVEGTSFHEGRLRTYKHNVNAPWMTLRISGRRFPFILDAQAETMNGSGIEGLTKAKPKNRRKTVASISRRKRKAKA